MTRREAAPWFCLPALAVAAVAVVAAPLERQFVPIPSGRSIRVLAADMGRDGLRDLVVLIGEESSLSIHLRRGDFFEATATWETIHAPVGVVAGFVDPTDRLTDLLVYNRRDAFLSVFLGDGWGAFSLVDPLFSLVEADPRGRFGFGDLDEDGLLDMVAPGGGGALVVSAPVLTSALPRAVESSVADPQVFAIGDFNRDGIQDILVWGKGLGSLLEVLEGPSFLAGYASGTLPAPGGDPLFAKVGDFRRRHVRGGRPPERGHDGFLRLPLLA